jgi:chromosome segregation ATPase
MSTTGKVLTVLIALVAATWVQLTASVTELNRNAAKQVAALKTQVDQLKADVARSTTSLRQLKDDTHQEQLAMQNELGVLEARQADAEKMKSEMIESATRVRLQLEGLEATVKAAQAQNERRLAERKAEEAVKKAALDNLQKLAAENDQLLEQLASLREHFRTSLRQGKDKVQRMLKPGNPPATRPASFTR